MTGRYGVRLSARALRQEVGRIGGPQGDSRSAAWWIPPRADFARFRLAPGACLAELRRCIDAAVTAECRRVVWALENADGHGLDEAEVRAVLGAFAAVESVRTGEAGGRKLLVAQGRVRQLGRAYLFTAPGAGAWKAVAKHLLQLRGARVTPIVLVPPASRPHGPGRAMKALVLAARSGFLIPALWSAAQDAGGLVAELASLRGAGLRAVPFARLHPDLPWDAGTRDKLKREGVRAGVSYVRSPFAAPASSSLPGAYFESGAYAASSFDRRVPAAVPQDDPWVEIVAESALDGLLIGGSEARQRQALARLELLLDFKRMERYHADMDGNVVLQQRYHEYRVYNWPPPDAATGLDLIEAGSLGDAAAVEAVLSDARSSPRRVCRSEKSILRYAEAQSGERQRPILAIVDEQRSEHGYLETVADAPLRADIAAFARFVPATLGRVLELGAGYGQLARELHPRARGYVRLELSIDMLRRGPASPAVAADIHRLPLADGSFDAVIANNVLEHAYDPVAALSDVRRILAPGGALYAFIPLDALNASHALPTHAWKTDVRGVGLALAAAGLRSLREEVVDLYRLGVAGSFPQCHGLVLAVEGRRAS